MATLNHARSTKRKRFRRLAGVCLSPVLVLVLLFGWSLWDSIGRCDEPLTVLSAMVRLEVSGEQIVPIGGRSDVLLAKVRGHQQVLDRHLARSGWGLVDWMGSEGQSRKGGRTLRVSSGAMFHYFRILGLGRSPYKDSG
jgi:hypothetical protein